MWYTCATNCVDGNCNKAFYMAFTATMDICHLNQDGQTDSLT
jgi:hypothetical protein